MHLPSLKNGPPVSLWGAQVHRLDAPTGGLVLVAKTRGALATLSCAFAQREVCKVLPACYQNLMCPAKQRSRGDRKGWGPRRIVVVHTVLHCGLSMAFPPQAHANSSHDPSKPS